MFTPSSTTTPSSSNDVPVVTTNMTDDALRVPGLESTGSAIFSADNFKLLGAGSTTPSDVSTANSPAVAPATAAAESTDAESALESFSLASGGAPDREFVLPPCAPDDGDGDEEEDEFIPRGKTNNPSSQATKPPHQPTAVGKPAKPAGK